MTFGGFEKDRQTLKYRCPAKQYGVDCIGQNSCPVVAGIRIKLGDDRRMFTPLARSSYAWERAYDKRTSVERVNSRLDGFFGFENHTIRGQKKDGSSLWPCTLYYACRGSRANTSEKTRINAEHGRFCIEFIDLIKMCVKCIW